MVTPDRLTTVHWHCQEVATRHNPFQHGWDIIVTMTTSK